jgi:DNA-binding transcriptional MocR family regulator
LKRPENTTLTALRIEPQSEYSLHRQIYQQLRQAILEQEVPAGTRLPSTRALARTLGVSRNTVLTAYEALVEDELLIARQGSGTLVRVPSEKVRPNVIPICPTFDLWAALRGALFPVASASLRDPDGNPLYVHR